MWPRYGQNDGERSNYGINREIRRDDIYIYIFHNTTVCKLENHDRIISSIDQRSISGPWLLQQTAANYQKVQNGNIPELSAFFLSNLHGNRFGHVFSKILWFFNAANWKVTIF